MGGKSDWLCNISVALITLSCVQPLLADDDILILKNGDRITGKIKKLEQGNIHIDADYGDNVFIIEWEQVERVRSSQNFVVMITEGRRLGGSIQTDPADASRIIIENEGQVNFIEQERMVHIRPVDEGFWGRFGASIDFGLNLTKANETKQFNTRASASYWAETWSLDGSVNTLIDARQLAPETNRTESGANFRYFITERWFGFTFGHFLQSDELELDLRSTMGGGVGRFLIQTNQWHFALVAGATWMHENYFDEASNGNNAEAIAGIELNGFNLGDLNLLTRYIVFPSLTDSGRVRMDFTTDFKWDLPKDLYFSMGFSTNYDSRPPADTPKNDYIFSSSVGWSY